MTKLKAPFPYFGGKSTVADLVWEALGSDVRHYIEPFCGSAAVLLARPDENIGLETINDKDGFVSNFWRAMVHDPIGVASWADNPVHETDLHARHYWLLGQRESLTERLMGDPEYFDVKVAGWWLWGTCCWIGSGFCSGEGSWIFKGGALTKKSVESNEGGVKRQIPFLHRLGQGISRQAPVLSQVGQGIHRCIPDAVTDGEGIESTRTWYHLKDVAKRLRDVRVVCGSWDRIMGRSVFEATGGMCGVFLDPPYSQEVNNVFKGLYSSECASISKAVRDWAVENGTNPKLRIVLAGYEGEHEMPEDWRKIEWQAQGGYSHQSGGVNDNNSKERLWLSPHCLRASQENTKDPWDF
jgi:DNA adenine methylase